MGIIASAGRSKMMNALSFYVEGIRGWWRDYLAYILLNLFWFLLQIPIITAPPATALLFALVKDVGAGKGVMFRDVVERFRRFFLHAWKWGVVNVIVFAALGVNFVAYRNMSGYGWMLLRWAWAVIGVLWAGINLLYWGFWHAQQDKRLWITLRNAGLYFLRYPVTALTVTLLALVLLVGGSLLTLPLVVFVPAWLAVTVNILVEKELGGVT